MAFASARVVRVMNQQDVEKVLEAYENSDANEIVAFKWPRVEILAGDGKLMAHRDVMMQSELVKSMIKDDADADELVQVHLLELSVAVLEKVIQFMEHYLDHPMPEIEKPLTTNVMADLVGEWYATWVDVDQELLFNIILAANYLDVAPLLDMAIAKVATQVKGRSPEEVKALFRIEPDITPEEERMVREQNPWIFDVAGAEFGGSGFGRDV
jgi:S-phase kinase-associated protein 1